MTRGLQAHVPTVTEEHAEYRRAVLGKETRAQLDARYTTLTGVERNYMSTPVLIDYLVWEEEAIAFTGADGDLVE